MQKTKLTDKEKDQIRQKTFINNMFYDDEFNDGCYAENIEIIKSRKELTRNYIKDSEYIDNELKENMLANDEFINLLSHFNIEKMLFYSTSDKISSRFYELATDYDKINKFFADDNAYTIISLYGGIVEKDSNGNYEINDNVINTLLKENGYKTIENETILEEIEQLIDELWENKKDLITSKKINDYSKSSNGLDFKYFLFCEEYIKTGRITEVARKLNIGRRTCYDYLNKKEVQEYLQKRQEEIKEENTEVMKTRYNQCFDTLYNMGNKNNVVSDDIKIKAIDTFLKHYENIVQMTAKINNNN